MCSFGQGAILWLVDSDMLQGRTPGKYMAKASGGKVLETLLFLRIAGEPRGTSASAARLLGKSRQAGHVGRYQGRCLESLRPANTTGILVY